MAFNLSLLDGVPTNMQVAREQFERLKKTEAQHAISDNKYLVLKINEEGKYKGLPSTWVYENPPTTKYIAIHRVKYIAPKPEPKPVIFGSSSYITKGFGQGGWFRESKRHSLASIKGHRRKNG